jgi:ribosomal protein L44E
MLRRRPAGQGGDGKGSGGDSSGDGKGDGKEHLHFDCKKCGTANEVAVVRVQLLPLALPKPVPLLLQHSSQLFCWLPRPAC